MKYFYFKDGCTRNAAACLKTAQGIRFLLLSEYFGRDLLLFEADLAEQDIPSDNGTCRKLFYALQGDGRGRTYGLHVDINSLIRDVKIPEYAECLPMMHFIIRESYNTKPADIAVKELRK